MSGWVTFWTIACAVGFAAFYALVVAVIPLGARDIFRLFRHLSEQGDSDAEG